MGSGATDLTEAQIEALFPIPSLINSSTQMNVSTSGIGVNNNNLNGATGRGLRARSLGRRELRRQPGDGGRPGHGVHRQFRRRLQPGDGGRSTTLSTTPTGRSAAPYQVTAGMLDPVTSGVAAGRRLLRHRRRRQADRRGPARRWGMGTIKIPVIRLRSNRCSIRSRCTSTSRRRSPTEMATAAATTSRSISSSDRPCGPAERRARASQRKPTSRSSSCSSAACRPSRIASTISGASSVSRRTLLT